MREFFPKEKEIFAGIESITDRKLSHSSRIKTGKPNRVQYNYAFNRNLSNIPIDQAKGNTILIFEADGKLNLSGGPELMSKEREKDSYFKKKERFVYVCYVDGTVARYRLFDGSVAFYNREKEEFSEYKGKGQTPYSPLRWEP